MKTITLGTFFVLMCALLLAQTNRPVTIVETTTTTEFLVDGCSSPQPDGRFIKQYKDVHTRTVTTRMEGGSITSVTNDVATNRAVIELVPVANRADGIMYRQ